MRMEITKGFQIDEPHLFIPWGITEKTLLDQFNGGGLHHVTAGYYTTTCKSLSGLNCNIGFHFDPRENGRLKELEFFRNNYDNQKVSFDDFQTHFEKEFGKPNDSRKGAEGFSDFLWQMNDIQIMHYVFNRYGPEEHMRIIKLY